MALAPDYLIDTNVLLRLSRYDDSQQPLIRDALNILNRQGAELYFSLQNIAEFWNVSTRPIERNGYGLSTAETASQVEIIERNMTLLPDNDLVYSTWRQLVSTHNVRGVQVHDARLAALMYAYGITHILTLNQPDFIRYSKVRVVHPSQVQP